MPSQGPSRQAHTPETTPAAAHPAVSTASGARATEPPQLVTPVPGPRSIALAARLAAVESRNVTFLPSARPETDPGATGSPGLRPVFWERASGANVWDADGNRFVDLTAAFGVANVGHAHPDVVAAIAAQAGTLLHGMGDVHPPEVKVELLEALAAIYPGGGAVRGVLTSSGSDAVETALKTALLASGRPDVLAFEGGYHGLSLGALDATFREDFRTPFAARLPGRSHHARFGSVEDVRRIAGGDGGRRSEAIGAVLVEPIQGRGGERVPPSGFLRALRGLCDERGWLLIADEVYTGFGRTGRLFACEHEGVTPDLLCVGKGLTSGMPLSACLGRAEVMDTWPVSTGEALHTQTFLGHPASCAAALASLRVLQVEGLVQRSAELGTRALARLHERLDPLPGVRGIRGLGLMLGVECASTALALTVCQRILEMGYLVLPSGEEGRVVSLTPPLCIDEPALEAAVDALAETFAAIDAAEAGR